MTAERVNDLVKKIKDKGGAKIKLKSSKSHSIKSFSYRDSRRSYTPDIVVEYTNKQDYYALEKKITAKLLPDLIAKWILFALEARAKSGKFFLVVTETHAELCRKLIANKQLSVELIVMK
ncbi:MAG: hypothetical protein WDZ35_15835 [Crocinitomicaceae bacterium]